MLLVALCHLRKSVAHDRNDHVQRGDCAEEGGQDEEDEADFVLRIVLILLYLVKVGK